MRERKITDYYAGQEIWDIRFGKGIVYGVYEGDKYPISCSFNGMSSHITYTIEGIHESTDRYPSLFFEEIQIPESASVPKKWEPKYGEVYYHIDVRSGSFSIGKNKNDYHCTDDNFRLSGNCFKTKEEVQAKIDEFLKLLKGE